MACQLGALIGVNHLEIVSFVAQRCRAEGRDPSGVPAAAPSTSALAQPRKEVTGGQRLRGPTAPWGARGGSWPCPQPCFSPRGSRGPTSGCEQDAAEGTSVRTWCCPCQRTRVGRSAWIRARACARVVLHTPNPGSPPSGGFSTGGAEMRERWLFGFGGCCGALGAAGTSCSCKIPPRCGHSRLAGQLQHGRGCPCVRPTAWQADRRTERLLGASPQQGPVQLRCPVTFF